ncbi:hypothetical protein V2G26_004842 [Clonostachys chloroleuca]
MLKALEFVRFFHNLKALHLRFTRDYWFVYDGELESMEFRLRFLHTVFSGITGESCPIDWDASYEDEREYNYHTSENDEQEAEEEGRSVNEAGSQLGDDENGRQPDDAEHETTDCVVEPEAEELEDEDEDDDEDDEEANGNDFFDLLQIPSELLENPPISQPPQSTLLHSQFLTWLRKETRDY